MVSSDMAIVGEAKTRRSKGAERRQELIEVTIDCLARHGYEGTTIGVVAEAVGMSRGIVNFHFETKEQLLLATLRFLSDEYRAHWKGALATAGSQPARRLWALAMADFDRAICTPRKLAAWCAFWGEAKTRPTYRQMCGANDAEYQATAVELCAALAPDGVEPSQLARGIVCMLEGLWLHLMMSPGSLSREEARAVAAAQLALLLPGHFSAKGPL
ncbi:TetR family transcriptional regulator C-terminal domain-containing protein [Labrys okinawensis]|uniref:TetR family transcriptional regulator C-terminal domain-containing protein n=1 Tax=Labrys okinawensis TaxID=346911 RepID=UPI0039BC53A2